MPKGLATPTKHAILHANKQLHIVVISSSLSAFVAKDDYCSLLRFFVLVKQGALMQGADMV